MRSEDAIKKAIAEARKRPDAPTVQIALIYVTAAMAAIFLDEQRDNRKPSQARVSRLVRSHEAGKWVFLADVLRFDGEFRLIDGQHRCLSSVKSGRGFWAIAVTGLDYESVFPLIDRPYVRTVSQSFEIMGQEHAKQVASSISFIVTYERERASCKNWNPAIDPTMAIEVLNAHEDIVRHVKDALRYKDNLVGWATVGQLALLKYGASQHDELLASQFVDQVATGTRLDAGYPALVLRNILQQRIGKPQGRDSRRDGLGYMIDAWRHFVAHGNGGKAYRCYWNPKQDQLPVFAPDIPRWFTKDA